MSKLVLLGSVAFIALAFATKYTSQTGALIAVFFILFLCLAIATMVMVVIFKKPEIAALEGMELVAYKQLTLGSKDNPSVALTIPVPDPKLREEATHSPDEAGMK